MFYNIEFNRLPFEPHPKQVIYVEDGYDVTTNEFIVRNHDYICDYYASQGYEFCYLPLLSSQFDMDVRNYYNPSCTNSLNVPIKSSFLLDYMAHPENRGNIKPSLLYYNEDYEPENGGECVLRGITIDSHQFPDRELGRYLVDILEDLAEIKVLDRRKVSFSEMTSFSISRDFGDVVEPEPEYITIGRTKVPTRTFRIIEPKPADDTFDDDTKVLVKEIEERIAQLEQRGISKFLLEQALFGPTKQSRMVITSDFRIILPDYDNMEIEMTPLVKAVYFLFLIHPDGIPFKHLPDYRNILLTIYADLRGGDVTEEMVRSVAAATSPLNNSINEKCARIREAFLSKFDERLIAPYIISGMRGEPKRITLPRNMVEWQTK